MKKVMKVRWTQLQAYTDREGHARPPRGFKTNDGFALGSWVATQRKSKESLSAERRQQLEDLDGWSWGLFSDVWNESYAQLKAYTDREGHARPSSNYKTSDGFALGRWVGTQRKSKDSLSAERFKLLDELNVF